MAPDLILANSTPVTVALRKHSPAAPIVFTQVTDPVGQLEQTGHSGRHRRMTESHPNAKSQISAMTFLRVYGCVRAPSLGRRISTMRSAGVPGGKKPI